MSAKSQYDDSYLIDGSQGLTNLLIQFIGGTSGISVIYKSLNNSIKSLNDKLTCDTNPNRYQILLDNNYDEMLAYTMDICHRRHCITLLQSILSLLITITNNSDDFIVRIASTNVPEILIVDTVDMVTCRCGVRNPRMVHLHLSVVFNIIRKSECRQYFWQFNLFYRFKESLQLLLYFELKSMKVTASMVLALLIKDGDHCLKKLLVNDDIIGRILNYVSKAIKRNKRSYKGFSLWEFMLGLQNLLMIDFVKINLSKTKEIINTVVRIVSAATSDSKEITVGLDILKNLCTNNKLRKKLINDFKIETVIESLTKSSYNEVQISANSLLDVLRNSCPPEMSRLPINKFIWETQKSFDQLHRSKSVKLLRENFRPQITTVAQPFTVDNPYDPENSYDYISESNVYYTQISTESQYETWDTTRVNRWLVNNKLSTLSNKIDGFDGDMLGSIKKLKINSPNVYYTQMETALKLTFPEILRLDRAIEKLE